jgi:hypothetical protein
MISRSVFCCRYGALENFGLACGDADWIAAYSPQKNPQVRFIDGLARAARIGSLVAQASIEQAICTRHNFFDLDSAICGSWVK